MEAYRNVVHKGAPLGVQLGALGTLEHMHRLVGQVGVKVHIEQGLLGKHCVTHHTLVD